MKKFAMLLATLFLGLTTPLWAQTPAESPESMTRCFTMEADAMLRARHQELGSLDDFEDWLAPHVEEYKRQAASSNKSMAVTTIPVVFHIIHDNDPVGSGDNLSAVYINAQLDQLNDDFRRASGTSGFNSHPDGADTEVEFCLATIDPSGNTLAEPGINRINRSSQGWSAPPYGTCTGGNFGDAYIENTIKPQSQWNPDDYLNIWVMDINCSILGYAQFPSSSGLGGLNTNGGSASTDGVVLLTSSLGSTTTPNPSGGVYGEGRTATHEVGHWLGLRHIWGDATCGNDYCADTPQQQGPSSGCPNTTTCDGVNDMVENYMDYSYDACMNIFTIDQKARIQTVLSLSPRRNTLAASGACGGGTPPPSGITCGTTISSFPYTEGFESGTGAWSNVASDDFDWARNSGGTPSSNTGPSAADEGSWYMYVEASSPNYSSKTTILEGPCFDFASDGTMDFSYHMYGAAGGVGTLSLEANTGSGWNTLWSQTDNQGNSWLTASVDLSAYTGTTVKLRFRGVTGNTWQGDMAVDNISVTAGGTPPPSGLTCSSTITSFPYNEGFEGNFGDWTQDSGDDFDWSINSGGTPSSNTGPSAASEGTYYAYTESSSPNYSNKTAILNGPCYDISGSPSFDFKYHMYGASNMGSLTLEANTGSGWSAIWSQSGNKGNAWLDASVDLSAYNGSTVALRFVGVTGGTWQGDMAIDALSIGGGGTGPGCTDVTLSITFDNYPEETSWEILDGSTVVESGGTYGSQADGSTLNIDMCLDAGCYDLVMYDSYGDGICCSYGNGSYTLTSGGSTLASGGSFGSSETTNFCVGGARVATTRATAPAQTAPALSGLELYPNPTNGLLNVRFKARGDNMAKITVLDLMGRELSTSSVEVYEGLHNHRMNLREIPAGSYMLRVEMGDLRMSKRFVIAK